METADQPLNLVVGLLQVGLGALVFAQLGRFGRTFPWLVALMVFSLVRGADRIYVAFSGESPIAWTLAADVLVVATLLLMIAGLRETVGGLQRAEDEATGRIAEYERALADYRMLMRHRIGNRITAVRGAVQTLAASGESLAADARERLVRMLDEQSRALEAEALDERLYAARPHGVEEEKLRPRPRRRFRRPARPHRLS